MVPFESFGTVSYSHAIVTMAINILYYFWDEARYWSKIAIFVTPAFDTLIRGPYWNIATTFDMEKLE